MPAGTSDEPIKRNTITKEHIDSLLASARWSATKMGEKTTVVCATLPNGFEVIESSGCVDASNYDHALGVETCKRRIVDKIWLLEGYRLQCELHNRATKPRVG